MVKLYQYTWCHIPEHSYFRVN